MPLSAPQQNSFFAAHPPQGAQPSVPGLSTRWRRPLVVGASGQLGREMCRMLEQVPGIELRRSSRQTGDGQLQLDLAALRSAEDAAKALGDLRPDLILCPGAMTHVDGCEAQPELALQVNARGPAALAAYAREHGIPFVFFSSDYVFNGTQAHPGPYAESDSPHPLNVYGESKLAGERMVLQANAAALVLRTSWVYGQDAAGKNFISFLLRQLRAKEPVRVPADQVSTPTFNRDLALTTFALLDRGANGVLHLTGQELMSREELARTVARFFGEDESLIHGVPTAELQQGAARPLLSGLRSERLAQLLPGWRPVTFAEGLRQTASLPAPGGGV